MQASPKKILIIRFSSIGDIVLTSPVYRCLKAKYPTSEIHVVVKEKMAGILSNNPHINKIHTLGEDGIWSLIRKLKKEDFDYIIDLHNNLRSLLLKTFLQVPASSVRKMNWRKWQIVHLKKPLSVPHIVTRYMEACQKLEVTYDGLGLDHFTAINAQQWFANNKADAQLTSNYVVFAIGGQFATKRLPVEKWVQLVETLNVDIVIVGGKEDSKMGAQIKAVCPSKVKDFTGQLSIDQSAELIKSAEKVYTNDTGMMHIAAAFNKELEVFWGNTSPAFGMYPFYPSISSSYAINHEVLALSCRPCSKIGFNSCPKGHFACMKQQEIGPQG